MWRWLRWCPASHRDTPVVTLAVSGSSSGSSTSVGGAVRTAWTACSADARSSASFRPWLIYGNRTVGTRGAGNQQCHTMSQVGLLSLLLTHVLPVDSNVTMHSAAQSQCKKTYHSSAQASTRSWVVTVQQLIIGLATAQQMTSSCYRWNTRTQYSVLPGLLSDPIMGLSICYIRPVATVDPVDPVI
jgi:hypothetical protein